MSKFLDENHVIVGLVPTTDGNNGNPATDVISMAKYQHICWIFQEGAGGTGTATIKVEKCTSAAGANNTAIAFNYRLSTTTDTWGALTAATSSGYTTVAGANKLVAIEVDASELGTSQFVRLQITEVVDSPCVTAVLAILSKPKYAEAVPVSAIA